MTTNERDTMNTIINEGFKSIKEMTIPELCKMSEQLNSYYGMAVALNKTETAEIIRRDFVRVNEELANRIAKPVNA